MTLLLCQSPLPTTLAPPKSPQFALRGTSLLGRPPPTRSCSPFRMGTDEAFFLFSPRARKMQATAASLPFVFTYYRHPIRSKHTPALKSTGLWGPPRSTKIEALSTCRLIAPMTAEAYVNQGKGT